MEKDNRSEWVKQLKPNLFVDIIKFAKEHPDKYKKARFGEYLWGGNIMNNQMTVDQLLKRLNTLSQNGYGDMFIFLGKEYPLSEDSITISPYENKLWIRNTYYDEKMTEAMRKAVDNLDTICRTYISDCYAAGRKIGE